MQLHLLFHRGAVGLCVWDTEDGETSPDGGDQRGQGDDSQGYQADKEGDDDGSSVSLPVTCLGYRDDGRCQVQDHWDLKKTLI